MKTIFYAHTGSGNHGCEALVRSTAMLLDCTPMLFSTGYDEDIQYGLTEVAQVKKDTVDTIPRKSIMYMKAACQTKLTKKTTLFTKYARKNFLAQVQKDDLCLSIGGDNYCYAGTEILGDLNILCKKKGAKTILWGCSIDPEVLTPEIIRDLRHYDLITVRESLTQNALAAVGVTKNVRIVADTAFLLNTEKGEMPQGFLPGNMIGLNLSPLVLQYVRNQEKVLDSFYTLVQYILNSTDSNIALIPHVTKEKGADLEILQLIYERFSDSGRVILIKDQNCMRLKYFISQCRLFIGARTHATIAAYSTFVPTLAIGYSVKSRGIATDLFGMEDHYVLPIQSIQSDLDLIVAFDWLNTNAEKIKIHLQKVIPKYQVKARMGKKYLNQLIK